MMLSYPRMVTRLAVFCGVISAIGSFPLISQHLHGPVKSIFGVYGRLAAGLDSIQVTEKANGQIGVILKLYYSNGHTCQLNENGKWKEDHVAIIAEGMEANRPCKLNLFFDNNRVLLKDEGFRCTPVYCGTRGKLDNASLAKFSPNRN